MWHKAWLALTALAAVSALVVCKSNDIDSTSITQTGTVIGPSGGVVSLADGTEVRIPAGALTADTSITLAEAPPSTYPPLGGASFEGKVYSFEPHGLKFDTPVVIDVAYSAPSSRDLVVMRAEPNGSWAPVPMATFTGGVGEVSATSFSFYAVVLPGEIPDVRATCSGRGPNASARTGTLSGFSGTIPGQVGSTYPPLDLTTVVDGYAWQHASNVGFAICDAGTTAHTLFLSFTPYAGACGHVENGVTRIGQTVGTVTVTSPAPFTTQSYLASWVNASTVQIPATTAPGPCGTGNSSATPNACASGPPAVTITAIDADHVAGSFSFTPSGGTSPIAGTFDLPFCTERDGLDPPFCCIP